MSEKKSLKKIIDDSAMDLKKARDNMDCTPRPPNPCVAHDSIFAVSRAQCNAVLALLAVESSRFDGASPEKPKAGAAGAIMEYIDVLTPWAWPIAFALFSPYIGEVVAAIVAAFR